MHLASIMFKGNPWAKPGSGPVGNLLLVRKTRTALKADLDYILKSFEVTGWALYDTDGMLTDGSNSSMCLNHTSKEFDSIDVAFRAQY